MKTIFFVLVMAIFVSIPFQTQAQTADEFLNEAQNALLHRKYEEALQLTQKAAGLVKSETIAIYRYEIILRLCYLQGASESLHQSFQAADEFDREKIEIFSGGFERYFNKYFELFEIAMINPNPLEAEILPHEYQAAKKLVMAVKSIIANEPESARSLAAQADWKLSLALQTLMKYKALPQKIAPPPPSNSRRKELS